jgi:hypothetical protein
MSRDRNTKATEIAKEKRAMNTTTTTEFSTYVQSLADARPGDVAVDIDGSSWSLIDASGADAGFATWEQLAASLAAGEEGWIPGPDGLDVYADGNVELMNAAIEAFWAVGS